VTETRSLPPPRRRAGREKGRLFQHLEEAMSVLTRCPASVWAGWFLGSFPFALSVVFFTSLMWESGRAESQLLSSSFWVALSFLWLQRRQRGFQQGLFRVLHPAWDPEKMPVPRGGRRSPYALIYLLGICPILHILVLLNWLFLLLTLPKLFFSLTGIENAFVQSPLNFLNPSFLLTLIMLTWLSVSPFHRAFFLLEAYYQDSRSSGLDLRNRLHALSSTLPLLLVVLGCCLSPTLFAAGEAVPLDQELSRVSSQRKFTWRLSPEFLPEDPSQIPGQGSERSFLDEFITGVFESFVKLMLKLGEWFNAFFNLDSSDLPEGDGFSFGNPAPLLRWLLVLLALLVLGLLVAVLRKELRRKRLSHSAGASELEDFPDLEDESLLATEKAPDEWLAMVEDLEARGEWRLALRALFLSVLAALADQNLLVVRRSKSNMDYQRELARRAHAFPGLLPDFRSLRLALEAVWYGDRPAGPELLQEHKQRMQHLGASQ